MILKDDFYHIDEFTSEEDGFTTGISINKNHVIYLGHFPGYPVTPGVVQLQVIHELLEQHLNMKFKLNEITDCKFLKVLNPNKNKCIKFCFKIKVEDDIKVQVTGLSEDEQFLKLRAIYEK